MIGGQAAAFGAHGSVSVINGARCNAQITSGCHQAPATVPTGSNTSTAAVDDRLHTVFAVNEFDDTMSAIDTRTCDGKVTSGCGKRPPNQQAEPGHGPGYAQFPGFFLLIDKLGTAYVMDEGGPNKLSVLDISRCNAVMRSGCRHETSSVPDHDAFVTEDPASRTIYAGNASQPRIDVISAAACHPGHLSGCAPVATIPMPHPQANVGGIDLATHTLYAADPFSDKVAVIDTTACNAVNTSGCSAAPALITVGPNPGPPGLNPVTKTLYVPDGPAFNQVAVINAATCNATDTSGCGQTPAQVSVAKGTFALAVSPAANTVYASATGLPKPGITFSGKTIAVINGAACNGTDHSGCGHPAATIGAGRAPFGLSVDDHTHTMYAAINTSGGFPGSVAVINTATCNGSHTARLSRAVPAHADGCHADPHGTRHRHGNPLRHRRHQRRGDRAAHGALQRHRHHRLPDARSSAARQFRPQRGRGRPGRQHRLCHQHLPGRCCHRSRRPALIAPDWACGAAFWPSRTPSLLGARRATAWRVLSRARP